MNHRAARLLASAASLLVLGFAGCGDIPPEPEKQTPVQKAEVKVEDLGKKAAKEIKDEAKAVGKTITEVEDTVGKSLQKDAASKKD